MRNNLLVFGFDEEPVMTGAEQTPENHKMKLLQFCESLLKVTESGMNIRFDLAHRIGSRSHDIRDQSL